MLLHVEAAVALDKLTSCREGTQRQHIIWGWEKNQLNGKACFTHILCRLMRTYHEEGVGGLDEALLLVLELLELRRRVQQVAVILQHHRGRLGFARAPRSLVSGRDDPKRRRRRGGRESGDG